MKKKIILLVILVIIITSVIGFVIYKNNKEKKAQERYSEIKERVKKGVEWNISAQYPGCTITNVFNKEATHGSFYNYRFLVNNGYIKKEELLDVDNKSYCDVFVDIDIYYENPLDHQNNCEVYYKIYLKCKDYKDKGYKDWGL